MRPLFLLTLLFVAQPSRAEVLFSFEHAISIEVLKAVQTTFAFAKERDPEMMKHPAYFHIFLENGTKTPLILSCPPMQPQTNGNGCAILITGKQGSLGEVSVSFRKGLSESSLSKAIANLENILQSDPNQFEKWNHKHVNNPFNSASDGTHIFCAAEGTQPNKAWSCRLSVIDSTKY